MAPAQAPQSLPPAPARQPNEAQEVWGTIQNTTSVAVLERYIQRFPGSFYGDIARARLAELKQNKAPAPSAARSSAQGTGAMSCAELNQPHDPQPVRQWLRDYLSSVGFDGDYQAAANGIGALCQESPQWSLEMSAHHWVEDLWGKRRATAATMSETSGDLYSCRDRNKLRSQDGLIPAYVTFRNISSGTVYVYWLDYSGIPVFYKSMEPGTAYKQQTYLSHPWMILDARQSCLQIAMPKQHDTDVYIR